MEHLSTQVERRQIEWRRTKVLELSSQGHSRREIADTIHVGIGTINRDMAYLRNEAQELRDRHYHHFGTSKSHLIQWPHHRYQIQSVQLNLRRFNQQY
jgi:hypothetical protein